MCNFKKGQPQSHLNQKLFKKIDLIIVFFFGGGDFFVKECHPDLHHWQHTVLHKPTSNEESSYSLWALIFYSGQDLIFIYLTNLVGGAIDNVDMQHFFFFVKCFLLWCNIRCFVHHTKIYTGISSVTLVLFGG